MTKAKTILLVEDNKEDQAFFIKAISHMDNVFLHAVAHNGQDALKRLHNMAILPDIIFMDISTPFFDSAQCLCELINDQRLKSIPVVVLSSQVDTSDVAKYLGAKGFIKKPHYHSDLADQVALMLTLNFQSHNYIADLSFYNAFTA